MVTITFEFDDKELGGNEYNEKLETFQPKLVKLLDEYFPELSNVKIK